MGSQALTSLGASVLSPSPTGSLSMTQAGTQVTGDQVLPNLSPLARGGTGEHASPSPSFVLCVAPRQMKYKIIFCLLGKPYSTVPKCTHDK